MSSWELRVDGVSIGAAVEYRSIAIQETAHPGTGVLRFRTRPGAAVNLGCEMFTEFYVDGVRVYRGYIRTLADLDTPYGRVREVTCQDSTSQLAADIIESNGLRPAGESDRARILALLAAWGTHGIVAGAEVQTIETSMPEVDYTGLSLYDAIADIAKLTGAQFYVGSYGELHYFVSEAANAPFGLSDAPDNVSTFGYADLSVPEDTTELFNRVIVYGADGVAPVVRSDAASIARYGTRTAAIRDQRLSNATTMEAYGDAFLAEHATARVSGTCRVFRPGLRAGQTVQITNARLGWNAKSWRINAVELRIVSATEAEYLVSFGAPETSLASQIGQLQSEVAVGVAAATEALVADALPPAPPTGLALSSDLATQADGTAVVRLVASLVQPTAPDLYASIVEVTAENDNDQPIWTRPARITIGREATSGALEGVRGSTRYWARAYAEDIFGNRSGYTAVVFTDTVRDAEAPPIPVNLAAAGGFRGIGVRWDSVGVADLAVYELQYAPEAAGGGPDLSAATVVRARTTAVWIDGLVPGWTYWVRVRAIDRSGNVRTSATDPTAVDAVSYPDAGWTDWVSAVPTIVGAADIAAASITSGHISTAGLSADVIRSGYLRVSTADPGVADGIEIVAGGKVIGRWDETGLYIGTAADGLPPGLAVDYVRLTEAGLTVHADGVPVTAVTPEGINATAIRFGVLPGGHNLVANSSFELSDFGSAPASKLWDVAADWNGSRVGSDVNVTTGAGSLTMTGTSY